MTIDDLKTKRVGILGLGVNNLALVRWLLKHGVKNVTICDQNPALRHDHPRWEGRVHWRLGPDYLIGLIDFDVVFRTPGISYCSAPIQAAQAAGVAISSQTKLFFELSPAKIIGVTGTKGKGTTATLIAEILRNQFGCKLSTVNPAAAGPRLGGGCQLSTVRGHRHVYLAGNIGTDPFTFLDRLRPDDWVVLELSSFQLQDLDRSPHIAVVLHIGVDHLDHHRDRDEYVSAKLPIVVHQHPDDYLVAHLDSLDSRRFAEATPGRAWWFSRAHSVDQGCFVRWLRGRGARFGDMVLRAQGGRETNLGRTYDVKLRGEHNLENITAAATAAHLAGARPAVIKRVIRNFRGLAHRLEEVGRLDGRTFYNDSFATNPEPTIAAIGSFSEPIHLIVGGSSKGADFTALADAISAAPQVSTIIPLGAVEGVRIGEAVRKRQRDGRPLILPSAGSMAEAVAWAWRGSQPGDVIVLSPAAASFDLFASYKERGALFRRAVARLRPRQQSGGGS